MFKKIVSLFLIIVLCFGLTVTAKAAHSYTRTDLIGDKTELRLTRECFTATKNINASSLGLEEAFVGITDVFVGKDEKVYVLCGENSNLFVLNSDYSYHSKLEIKENGEPVDFSGAEGIFVEENGNIYLCDTANARILYTDSMGNVIKSNNLPQSDLIPADFVYQPISMQKDAQGYKYVLSLGCYYGVLLFNPDDAFLGFYGSNTVKSNALDTLSYFWNKLTSNDEKKNASIKTLPYSFVDFDLDANGYMVTCTGSTEKSKNGKGQIRKISPNGANILYKRNTKKGSDDSSSVNFLEERLVLKEDRTGNFREQTIVSIEVSQDGYIYALDSTHGTIYCYDSACNNISSFGGGLGQGTKIGEFVTPVDISLKGDDIIVADYDSCSLTVFSMTEYGKMLTTAQTLYLHGDYEKAKPLWEQILKLERNNQYAYRGLAMTYYNEGNYQKALEYAEISCDYSVYDMAWKEIRNKAFTDNFSFIVLGVLLVAGGLTAGFIVLKRKNKQIKNEKISVLLKTPFHPFESFEKIKFGNKGSVLIAVIITILFYIAEVLNETAVGYLYKVNDLKNYNALYTLISTVGLLLLWSVANWLVCSMFSGKGNLKCVYISSAYSLVPYIAFRFVRVLLTLFLPLSSAGLISGLNTAFLIFTFFLICIAMITIHEYDFFKFIWTGIIIIFFMLLAVFVLFMFFILLKQCGTFVSSVFEEVIYR